MRVKTQNVHFLVITHVLRVVCTKFTNCPFHRFEFFRWLGSWRPLFCNYPCEDITAVRTSESSQPAVRKDTDVGAAEDVVCSATANKPDSK
jgi:hypothetical protein